MVSEPAGVSPVTFHRHGRPNVSALPAGRPLSEGRDFYTRVVVAGSTGDVRVMARAQRGDRLPVVARPEPGAFQRQHDAWPHGVRDLDPEVDDPEVIPDLDSRPVAETPRGRVLGMHLERRRACAPLESAER